MVAFLAVTWAVSAAVLLGLAGAALRRYRDHDQLILRISGTLERIAEGAEEDLKGRLRDVEDLVDRLPKKWEDIKREAAAAETRSRNHIRRAQKELEERGFEDPGIDQLAQELRVHDGDGSEDGGVQPLRSGVESGGDGAPPESFAGAEDWRAIASRKKYG